ncbi:Integrase zinc-binding domain - like 10 [Theobroma cacao]|nr:Integrase zinc-binding domain - like 10 [Theobroma cacao]
MASKYRACLYVDLVQHYRDEKNMMSIPYEEFKKDERARIPKERKGKMLTKGTDGVLRYGTRLYVPNNDGLRRKILEEAHMATYVVHLGATKMYQDLKKVYWWEGLKKDVAEFISKFLVCQQVKVEHRRPASLLQPLPVLE